MKKKGSIIGLFIFIMLFFICVGYFLPIEKCLSIEELSSGRELAYIPLKGERAFQIQYTHSIHLSEVKEFYKIQGDGNIRQVELMYKDTAIGMPSNAEKGETFEMKNGEYYIKNMKRVFPYINLSTGQVVANHRIIFKGRTYPLKDTIKPGTIVQIKVEKLTLYKLWRGVNILD
ncbi:DUF1850 domain-containing protein [Falsibacillus albus]|uniref:DUF1850 domain-containing protein n=1 Tax=Falsibacillus albus TaxID=2478915 RepID=A0A3L7K930_9BACI|nr:DUF1850 domain-containing protein [Falsibacillus albus]RLQ97152.1 DUF1850 domain-containing protein [Falsibacillus albus]